MAEQSPILDNRFPADPNKLRQQLGVLTTMAFRAAVVHRTPPERGGILESIVHLREVSNGNALVVGNPQRAARDVRFADLVGQLNQVGLGLPYEDTSIRRVIETDADWWQGARSARRRRSTPGVGMLLRVFFTNPEEYVSDRGEFLPDLGTKSLEFWRGPLGGFVLDRLTTAGDQGHRKPGSRTRRWRDEVRRRER